MNKYLIKKICPECYADKQYFHYDIYKDELSCRKCGLILEAPYIAGIIFPGVKIVRIKLK